MYYKRNAAIFQQRKKIEKSAKRCCAERIDMKKEKKAIFIHSLFRTGSTYIWNKFRKNERYCCYYEPFHPELAEIALETPSPWAYDSITTDKLRHPRVEKDYLFEYKKLLHPGQKGIPFFKKSFSFDDFCNNDDNPDQKRYIDYLVESSGDQIPVLQFNRSALRVQWFKRNYPGAINIYLVRNPRDQFQSYMSMAEDNQLDIFLAMDLLVAGINRETPYFKPLAVHLPLWEYHAPNFEDEQSIYRVLLPVYTIDEKYFISYFIWYTALLENLLHADFLLNINLLSTSDSYRHRIHEQFAGLGLENFDFNDANIGKYKEYSLNKEKAAEIEEIAQSLIIKSYSNKDIERIDSRLDNENRDFFKIDKTTLENLKQKEILPIFPGRDRYRELNKIEDYFCLEGKYSTTRFLVCGTAETSAAVGLAAGKYPHAGLRSKGYGKRSFPGVPLITVITVVLNEPTALEKTIYSVLEQTYVNIEFIIIDGGSSGPTLEVIKHFDDRIDCWTSAPNHGIFDAMNKGIDLATGEWINFLNAGDYFYEKDTVQKVFNKKYGTADFIYGHTYFLGGDFKGIVKTWDFSILWKTMVFTHQSLFTHSRILKNRKFDTTFKICADYDIVYNSYMEGRKFFNADMVIAAFEPGFSDVSRSRVAYEKWKVVKKHRHDLQFHWFYLKLVIRRFYRDMLKKIKLPEKR